MDHAVSVGCERCIKQGRTCTACAQQRRRAWTLVVSNGETVELAADVMKLAAASVRPLVAEEIDAASSAHCDPTPSRSHASEQ